MAPRPERSHQGSSSLHHIAVDPFSITSGQSAPLCHTSSHSFSHPFCSPSPATSPSPPFSFELGNLPEGSRLSHSVPTSDPTLYSNSTSTTVGKTPARLGVSYSCLSTLVLPGAFYCLSSLPDSPQLQTACATPQQRVIFSSTASAPPVNEYTIAARATRPHTTALRDATTPAGDGVTVEQTTPPSFEKTADEERECSAVSFQTSVEVFKTRSSVHPPKTSPEVLHAKQANSTASAAAAQPAATCWEAAAHSCYQDHEACHPFAHIVPSGLHNYYSLHGRTLLSPPAADFPSPVEDTEALHAGLRLDSPLRTRLSSPTSVHSYNHNDPGERYYCAFINSSREASGLPSPVLYHKPHSSRRLPAFVSPLPKSLDTSSSTCESQVYRLCTHDMHPAGPEIGQSPAATTEQHMLPLGDLRILAHEREDPKDKAQRTILPIDKETIKAAGYIEFDVEGFTARHSERDRIRPPIFYTFREEEYNKVKNNGANVVSSYSLSRKKSLKACTSSPLVSGQQTMAGTSACQRGNNRRKRRRGISPTHNQGGSSASVESSLQNVLHCHVPAALAATCVAMYPEPRLALRLKSASAAPSMVSPAATPISPSTVTGNSVSSADDIVAANRMVAAPAVTGALGTFPASNGTGAPGTVDAATMLSATFTGSDASTVADGVPMTSSASIRRSTSAPVDESVGMSASRALPGFDFHFCAGAANEQLTFYSDTSACLAHEYMTRSGSSIPAAVSAQSGGARSSFSPAAIVYALAVKLFGFTPTPGFLPDPNPFDDPDHYLTRKLMRATVTKSPNRKTSEVESIPAPPDPQTPAIVRGEFVPHGRTLSMPAAADSRLPEIGNVGAHTRQHFSPSAQRGDKGTEFLTPNSTYAQPHYLGRVRRTEVKNSTVENSVYTYSVPSSTAATSPFNCESPTPAVCNVRSRTDAMSTLRTSGHTRGHAPNSTKFSQQPASVECCRSSNSSTSSHELHGGSAATEVWYAQSEFHLPARNLVNTIDYISESGCTQQGEVTGAEYQTQDTSLVGQQYLARGVENCAYHSASMNDSSFAFDKNETGEIYYMHNGSNDTACEVYPVHNGGGPVLNDEGRLQTAQFPFQAGHCPKTISYADEEPPCDCVTGSCGIGGKVLHSGCFEIRPVSSYGIGAAPAAGPIQNSSYLRAAPDLQCQENSIFTPTYLHGNDSLYPTLCPHDGEPVSQSSIEFLDRMGATISPSTELMAERAGAGQAYYSPPNHPHFPGSTCILGETGDRASLKASINEKPACMATGYISKSQQAISLYGEK